MAAVAHLDTHVAVWLHTGALDELSRGARRAIERDDLAVSPFVRLELTFLHEAGRLAHRADAILDGLGAAIGLREASIATARVVRAAGPLAWTRDPFDRLIVGTALASGASLLTRDEAIRRHCPAAVW